MEEIKIVAGFVSVIVALLAGVVWLIRLESTTKETKKTMEDHISNVDVHGNKGRAELFEKRMDEKFDGFEEKMNEIKSDFKAFTERQESTFSATLSGVVAELRDAARELRGR